MAIGRNIHSYYHSGRGSLVASTAAGGDVRHRICVSALSNAWSDSWAFLADASQARPKRRPNPCSSYPVDANVIRPAHIHDVTGRLNRIVTQMYFGGDPYNAHDRWLQSATCPEALIVRPQLPTPDFEPDSRIVTFDIVLIDG